MTSPTVNKNRAGVNGVAVLVVTVGGVILVSGLTNKKISKVVLGFLQGTAPTPDIIDSSSSAGSGVGSGVGSGGVPNLTTGSVQKQIANFLINDMGLSRAGAAAVLGNFQIESGFSTTVLGDNGTSQGIAQWHAGRLDNLKAYARSVGGNYTDLNVQLGFFKHEITSDPKYASLLQTLRTTNDAGSAAAEFDQTFEGSTGAARSQRISAAQRFYLMLQNLLG